MVPNTQVGQLYLQLQKIQCLWLWQAPTLTCRNPHKDTHIHKMKTLIPDCGVGEQGLRYSALALVHLINSHAIGLSHKQRVLGGEKQGVEITR